MNSNSSYFFFDAGGIPSCNFYCVHYSSNFWACWLRPSFVVFLFAILFHLWIGFLCLSSVFGWPFVVCWVLYSAVVKSSLVVVAKVLAAINNSCLCSLCFYLYFHMASFVYIEDLLDLLGSWQLGQDVWHPYFVTFVIFALHWARVYYVESFSVTFSFLSSSEYGRWNTFNTLWEFFIV